MEQYASKNPAYGRQSISTDADSSTDAIGGWTKNTQKHELFEKTEKVTKNAKTQTV